MTSINLLTCLVGTVHLLILCATTTATEIEDCGEQDCLFEPFEGSGCDTDNDCKEEGFPICLIADPNGTSENNDTFCVECKTDEDCKSGGCDNYNYCQECLRDDDCGDGQLCKATEDEDGIVKQSCQACYEVGKHYSGKEIKVGRRGRKKIRNNFNKKMKIAADCQDACRKDKRCKWFNWTPGKDCIFKTEKVDGKVLDISTDGSATGSNNCPINGDWGSWTEWSACSVTCNGGNQTRGRICDSPPPLDGGRTCGRDGRETRECGHGSCIVKEKCQVPSISTVKECPSVGGAGIGSGRLFLPSTVTENYLNGEKIRNVEDFNECCGKCQDHVDKANEVPTLFFEYNIERKKCTCYIEKQGDIARTEQTSKSSHKHTGLCCKQTGPPDCSGYTPQNLPRPRILLLGATGVGKSTLGNFLLGKDPKSKDVHFKVGHTEESQTMDISYKIGNWLGTGQCFTVIDTPGTSDTDGRDYEHAISMAKILKDEIKAVDLFLLLFNGKRPRFDASTIGLLKLYVSMFTSKMWSRTVTQFTFWPHDEHSIKVRQDNQHMNESVKHNQWQKQYKENFGVQIQIPSVFINPMIPVYNTSLLTEKKQCKKFGFHTKTLWDYAVQMEPFSCSGNCNSPNGFFVGQPWIKKNEKFGRLGDNVEIQCEIWNGIATEKKSDNITWSLNGTVFFNKTQGVIQTSDPSMTIKEENSLGGELILNSILTLKMTEAFEGNYECNNGVESENNVATASLIVDGTWLEWTPWSGCSRDCVGKNGIFGSTRRSRLCSQPRNKGLPCAKNGDKESKSCPFKGDEIVRCPEDFSWNNWSKWSDCSLSCGGGTKAKLRSCKDGQYGGKTCPKAQERMIIPCNNQACPDCILEEWGIWSSCSQDCLNTTLAIPVTGIRHRSRKHSEADPYQPVCNPKDLNQKESCNTQPCPVDFAWSTWSSWSTCSPECGNGKSSRTRFCKEGRHGGKVCPNPQENEEESCELKKCPQCVLRGWEDWSNCTKTCYDSEDPLATQGTKTRRRNYSEADASNPKCKEIENLLSQTETCNSHQCPVNSKWAEWTSWSTCSTSCDDNEAGVIGKKERLRTCIEGQYGGTTCPPAQGNNSESLSCNNAKCPVDGEWETWSPWGSCSKDCVGEDGIFGQRKRERKCKPPKYFGKWCDSKGYTQKEACPYKEGNQEFIKCKIDARWGEWTAYSKCSTTCGTGVKTKQRVCLQGLHGGSACPPIHGEKLQTDQCFFKEECEVNCEWSEWALWSKCNKGCGGGGKKTRKRTVTEQARHGGIRCEDGGDTEKQDCFVMACPPCEKGQWSSWSNDPCPKGKGWHTMERSRQFFPPKDWAAIDCSNQEDEKQTKQCQRCPESWDYVTALTQNNNFKEGCYLPLRQKATTWKESKKTCSKKENFNGYLAEITSQAENDAVIDFIKKFQDVDFWIGLNDEEADGIFEWTNSGKRAKYTNFNRGEPNNAIGGNEDCVHYGSYIEYKWNDLPCTQNRHHSCPAGKGCSWRDVWALCEQDVTVTYNV